MRQTIQTNRFARPVWTARALLLGASVGALSGCESLLEVELPHLLTDAAIEGAGTAETQVNSAIALFECGYTAFGLMALGHDDAMESVAGVFGGGHVYDVTPNTGACDLGSTSANWFDQIMGARAMLTTAPARLVPSGTGVGRGVYDRIQNEWSLGSAGERLSAIGAIYVAASLTHMGEFLCEAAIDGSDVLTPTDVLGVAEAWVGRALGHITTDFVMPNNAAPSASNMAVAIRARLRWANRDFAGAAADAATVLAADPDFNVWITREAGLTRRNMIYHNATEIGYSKMLGVNTWWRLVSRRPNPATGQQWPATIPFTGYIFIGVMPDGRMLEAGNIPVRYAQEIRNASEQPISLGNGAVADSRVKHRYKEINGPGKHELPERYAALDTDIPYMTWEELMLIQADYQLSLGGAANLLNAINIVNTIRAFPGKNVAAISGAYRTTLTDGTNDAAEVRYMLIEERRREFFAEGGRYWSTKIQNTDLLWFPRAEGSTVFRSYNLQGAVRQQFAENEYERNQVWAAKGGRALRGTGCTTLFGSQAPYIT